MPTRDSFLAQYWSLVVVVWCSGMTLGVMMMSDWDPDGAEEVPRWAFRVVNLVYLAIFFVALHMCMTNRVGKSDEK